MGDEVIMVFPSNIAAKRLESDPIRQGGRLNLENSLT